MNDINDFYVRCFKSYVRQKQFISILQFLLLLIYFGLVIAAPTYLIINGVSRFGLKSLSRPLGRLIYICQSILYTLLASNG